MRRLRLPCSRAECAKHVKEHLLSRYPVLRQFCHTIRRQTQTELFKVARKHGYTRCACRDYADWMNDLRKAGQKRRQARALSVAGDLHGRTSIVVHVAEGCSVNPLGSRCGEASL